MKPEMHVNNMTVAQNLMMQEDLSDTVGPENCADAPTRSLEFVMIAIVAVGAVLAGVATLALVWISRLRRSSAPTTDGKDCENRVDSEPVKNETTMYGKDDIDNASVSTKEPSDNVSISDEQSQQAIANP